MLLVPTIKRIPEFRILPAGQHLQESNFRYYNPFGRVIFFFQLLSCFFVGYLIFSFCYFFLVSFLLYYFSFAILAICLFSLHLIGSYS
ncbi:hypothetical protein C2G38_2061707, partial [Gigaspora rosea]